jgi:hypothetical protein
MPSAFPSHGGTTLMSGAFEDPDDNGDPMASIPDPAVDGPAGEGPDVTAIRRDVALTPLSALNRCSFPNRTW